MSAPESARSAAPPPVLRMVETALYFDGVEALHAAAAFYRDTLGLHVMSEGDRLVSVDAGGGTVLLLFQRGETAKGLRWLAGRGVEVESRVSWPRGGRSLYLRDPGGHSVELVTPGTWDNF